MFYDSLSVHGPGLLFCFTTLFVGLLSPGASVLAIMGASLSRGRRAGLATAAGTGSGTTTLAFLTVAGVSALLAARPEALWAVRVLGGSYFLWLAYRSFRSAASESDLDADVASEAGRVSRLFYLRGLAIHLTNPKAYLVWLAIASLGVRPDAPIWILAILVLGAGMMSFGVNMGYALLFSNAFLRARYVRSRRVVQGALGACFGVAGLRLLSSRL